MYKPVKWKTVFFAILTISSSLTYYIDNQCRKMLITLEVDTELAIKISSIFSLCSTYTTFPISSGEKTSGVLKTVQLGFFQRNQSSTIFSHFVLEPRGEKSCDQRIVNKIYTYINVVMVGRYSYLSLASKPTHPHFVKVTTNKK